MNSDIELEKNIVKQMMSKKVIINHNNEVHYLPVFKYIEYENGKIISEINSELKKYQEQGIKFELSI